MNVCHQHLFPEGDVPHVVGLVNNLGVYVELQRGSEGAPYPETGHEDDHVVAIKGSCKFLKLQT